MVIKSEFLENNDHLNSTEPIVDELNLDKKYKYKWCPEHCNVFVNSMNYESISELESELDKLLTLDIEKKMSMIYMRNCVIYSKLVLITVVC